MKKALIVYGGWEGHTPKESAAVFEPELKSRGYDVEMRDSLDAYTDEALMQSADLIVPIWTMGEISKEQWQGLHETVHAGCGLAGFHGGIIDSFRNNNNYQMMTGGQFVGHPGNTQPTYEVYTVDKEHEITKGIDRFTLPQTEQYYMHVDPGVHVLMSSRIDHGLGDTTTYPVGVEMPYCWTRRWGRGRVFVAAWGHTYADFDVPEAKEIVLRGMEWATR